MAQSNLDAVMISKIAMLMQASTECARACERAMGPNQSSQVTLLRLTELDEQLVRAGVPSILATIDRVSR